MTATHDPQIRSSGESWQHASDQGSNRSYLTRGLELAADFAAMFFVMYAMIATLDHLYLNTGNGYMTMMMVAPMALLMLVFMRREAKLSNPELIELCRGIIDAQEREIGQMERILQRL